MEYATLKISTTVSPFSIQGTEHQNKQRRLRRAVNFDSRVKKLTEKQKTFNSNEATAFNFLI